jgi:hypothetical protein
VYIVGIAAGSLAEFIELARALFEQGEIRVSGNFP